MKNTNNIPRWNMDSIFTGLESSEYKKTLSDIKIMFENQKALLDTADNYTKNDNEHFDFAQWLDSYITADNKLTYNIRTVAAFAYTIYSTDTTNTAYMNNLNVTDELFSESQQLYIRFSTLLTAHQNQLKEFYARFPKYNEYSYILQETIEQKKHQMAPALEKLANDLNRTGGNAWGLLQEQLISNLADNNGKTFNELRNDANCADPALRKESYLKELELLKQNRIAFAASLNNLKGQTVTLNKLRNWDSALARSLSSARITKETLNALIGAIEDSLPMWRQYFMAKAKLLRKAGATVSTTSGTEINKGIAFYDLFAPVENPDTTASKNKDSLFSKTWNFNDARDYVIKEYYSFSKDMGDFATNAFNNNWIDAEVRSGKVGGAYDEDFPKGHQSRILTNFTGTFSDIITLAHEIGHAYHFSCLKDKDPVFFDYPMTLAETASTFAETIVKQDMLKQSKGFDRIKIMDLDLTDTSQVLVDILCRFYFEQSVFENRASGELNADDFCRLMKEAQEKSYGCGLNEERHEYMWAVKSHYYSTDLDFYNYPYAFGQLFAAGLYMQSLKKGPEFAETYKELLADTGSMSCEDLCKKAGFDITSKDFWESGIKMYAAEVKEYTEFVNGL